MTIEIKKEDGEYKTNFTGETNDILNSLGEIYINLMRIAGYTDNDIVTHFSKCFKTGIENVEVAQ